MYYILNLSNKNNVFLIKKKKNYFTMSNVTDTNYFTIFLQTADVTNSY